MRRLSVLLSVACVAGVVAAFGQASGGAREEGATSGGSIDAGSTSGGATDGGSGSPCSCSGTTYCTPAGTCGAGHALIITVSVHTAQDADAGVRWTNSSIGGYFYEPVVPAPPPAALPSTIATDGACKVTRYVFPDGGQSYNPDYRVVLGDHGDVSVTGSTAVSGVLRLARAASPAEYLAADLSGSSPVINTGDTLRLAVSGGRDLPELGVSVIARTTPLRFTSPVSLRKGQPAAVAWNGGNRGNVMFFLAAYDAVSSTTIWCHVPDTGSFTIPASLTQHLPSGRDGFIRMQRDDLAEVAAPSDPSRKLSLSVTIGSTMNLLSIE